MHSPYFRARYYDPHTAEFISPDPLEYVDGMSLFRGYFVVNGSDANGMREGPQAPPSCCCCAEDFESTEPRATEFTGPIYDGIAIPENHLAGSREDPYFGHKFEFWANIEYIRLRPNSRQSEMNDDKEQE